MTRSTDISPLSVLLSKVDAVSDGAQPGETFACGFPSVDSLLGGGFRRGDLIVLGGDTASGKSSMALAFAVRASARDTRVAFLSGEMSIDRVLERVIAIEARAKIDDLRQGNIDDLTRAAAESSRCDSATDCRWSNACSRARRPNAWARSSTKCRMSTSSSSIPSPALQAEFGRSTKMWQWPFDNSKPSRWIEGWQFSPPHHYRASPFGPDRRPTLDDFGALGCVQQHADVVLGLFREGMYEPSRDVEGATELLIRKNRNGPTGYVDLYFYPQWMRFEDMLDPER